MWGIQLRTKGLAWAPGSQVDVTVVGVVPGGLYTIVLDDVSSGDRPSVSYSPPSPSRVLHLHRYALRPTIVWDPELPA